MNSRRIINALIIALVVSGACTYLLSRKIGERAAQSTHESLKSPFMLFHEPPNQAGLSGYF